MSNLTRSRRSWRRTGEHAPVSARAVGFYWVIGLGSVAVAGFSIMAMMYALRGRDPSAWSLLAMYGGFLLSISPVIAPAFTKQRSSQSIVPGPLSAKRAAFISISSLWMALYVLAISNVHRLFDISAWPRWAGIVAVFAAVLPIGGVIYAALRYLAREADEYQRMLLMRAALIAAGATLFAITVWGLLELYVSASHMPLAMALAPFCIVFAIANWWLRGRV